MLWIIETYYVKLICTKFTELVDIGRQCGESRKFDPSVSRFNVSLAQIRSMLPTGIRASNWLFDSHRPTNFGRNSYGWRDYSRQCRSFSTLHWAQCNDWENRTVLNYSKYIFREVYLPRWNSDGRGRRFDRFYYVFGDRFDLLFDFSNVFKNNSPQYKSHVRRHVHAKFGANRLINGGQRDKWKAYRQKNI